MKKSIIGIILAAGKGTRFQASDKNKVFYNLADKPIVAYSAELLKNAGMNKIVIVVGFKKEKIKNYLGEKYIYVNQGKLLGTGHAVKQALKVLAHSVKNAVVLYADHSAFYKPGMIENLIQHHQETDASITFISVYKQNPTNYGRIIRNKNGKVEGIREEKDASIEEKKIKEINTGTYCFKISFLRNYISKIKKNPIKGEYYLTDLVEIASKEGLNIETITLNDELVTLGINTRLELEKADKIMRKLRNK